MYVQMYLHQPFTLDKLFIQFELHMNRKMRKYNKYIMPWHAKEGGFLQIKVVFLAISSS